MSDRQRRRFPSAAFIGSLIGVGGALVVSPPMMLTSAGTVLWLLGWSGLGLVAGAVVETFVRFRRLGSEVGWVEAQPTRLTPGDRGCETIGADKATNPEMHGMSTPKVGERFWCLWATSDALNLGFGTVPPWEGAIVEVYQNAYRIAPLDELGPDGVVRPNSWVSRDATVTAENLYKTEAAARDAYIKELTSDVAHLAESLAEKRAVLVRWEAARDAGLGGPVN